MNIASKPNRVLGRSSAFFGFSLVELILAIGLFSFVLVTLVGLIPLGLQEFQHSKQSTAETLILSQLTQEIRQTDYSLILTNGPAYSSTFPRYYDYDGLPLKGPTNAYYTVPAPIKGATLPYAISLQLGIIYQRQPPGTTVPLTTIWISDNGR